jgi:hypothetical protein
MELSRDKSYQRKKYTMTKAKTKITPGMSEEDLKIAIHQLALEAATYAVRNIENIAKVEIILPLIQSHVEASYAKFNEALAQVETYFNRVATRAMIVCGDN